MDPKTRTKRKGIIMAMKVAALSVAAGSTTMALTASEADAGDASGMAGDGAQDKSAPGVSGIEPVALPFVAPPARVQGWSCWGAPVSRGPLAPPVQCQDDFEALLAEVPA